MLNQVPHKQIVDGKIIKYYPTDALYPSPYDWVSCGYLMRKVKQGTWKNIFLDDCETRIVSPGSLSFEDYKAAHIAISCEWRTIRQRYDAMTHCPLLQILFGVCEIERDRTSNS